METTSDDELVRHAQREPSAFGLLYERYRRPIYTFILWRVHGNADVAQDLTSQVFTKAFGALPRFQVGAFRSWLYAIARNAVTDQYRRQRPTAPLAEADQMADDQQSLDDRLIAEDARAELHAALSHLGDTQREIVLLRLQGLTGAEIAQRMNMHPDAVKSTQYRAFAKLRTYLQDPTSDQSDPSNQRERP